MGPIWKHENGERMLHFKILTLTSAVILSANSLAADYLSGQAQVTTLIKGKVLHGTYLRTGSAYSLRFGSDGTLVNQREETGKWWVNEQGQYCREWNTGRLSGNRACMHIALEQEKIAFYSRGKRVAVGILSTAP